MQKVSRTDIGKFSHFFPFSATIVTSHFKGRDNAMAVAWHMPISAVPPLYGVGISSDKLSHEFISKTGEFGVNFMPFEAVELVAATGGPSGRKIDKFKAFDLKKHPSIVTNAPILSDAYASFECIVEDQAIYGDHTLFIGKVVALHHAPEAYDERGHLNLNLFKPTLYLGGDDYIQIKNFDTLHLGRSDTAEKVAKRNT
ncbi:MAG: flavin reductase family protein [Dehalococcoidales bacterium]|jgi:flavin reductase (DIM6/NTAB) family NADH-FMN oxidoreductase RutF|nr:flavin reductase family protein [Dehalococcoidales bacterium]MDX9985966.1 flavin reductase family protein [Dehalococcoidales bacterium]NLE89470.1 flavin reductase family protein [Dehalococcoidales bacterium]